MEGSVIERIQLNYRQHVAYMRSQIGVLLSTPDAHRRFPREELYAFLNFAVDERDWNAVRLLVQRARLNLNFSCAKSILSLPLNHAVWTSNVEGVCMLLALGANPDHASRPLMVALELGSLPVIARILIAHGARFMLRSPPWVPPFKVQLALARRCSVALMGVKRFRSSGLVRMDRFLVREIAVALFIAAIHHPSA